MGQGVNGNFNNVFVELRRNNSAFYAFNNPVLAAGEPAYETDTNKLKIGNGITPYNSLPYFGVSVAAPGTVTSVNITGPGGALSSSGGPITTVGTLAIVWQGTSAQLVAGNGSLLSSIPGSLVGLSAGEVGFGSASNTLTGSNNLFYDATNVLLYVNGSSGAFPNTKFQAFDNVNSFTQINYQNLNSSSLASTDYVATADNGTNSTFFANFGINSSTFTDPTFTIGGFNAGYLYTAGGNQLLGTSTTNDIVFFTGGTLAANERFRINSTGNVSVSTGKLSLAASTTSYTALNFSTSGVAPTSPNNGDVYYTPATGFTFYTNDPANTNSLLTIGNSTNTLAIFSDNGPNIYIYTPTATSNLTLSVGGTIPNYQIDPSGGHTWQTSAQSGGTPVAPYRFLITARTNQSASTEQRQYQFNMSSTQFATGALALQRGMLINNPTYSFVGASTITQACTVAIFGAPVTGTNSTVTTAIGLLIQSAGVATFGPVGTSYGAFINAQTGAATNWALGLSGNLSITGTQTISGGINNVTITPPTTSATLTLITGSTLTTAGAFNLTLTTTGASTPTFPSGVGTLAYLSGVNNWAPTARTSGAIAAFTFTAPADTGQTASTSIPGWNYIGGSRQWNTGAIASQVENSWSQTIYTAVAASTITTAVGNDFYAPLASTNITITNNYAIRTNGNTQNLVGTVTNGIIIRDLVGTSTNGAFYIGVTPSATNYAMRGDASGNTFLNGGQVFIGVSGTSKFTFGASLTIADAYNIIVGTTAGTQFGQSLGKISFYGATPIVQPVAATDLGTVLSSLGLRVAGTAYPITTSGSVILTGNFTTGNIQSGYVAKAAIYTIAITDYMIDCTGTFTVTLPTAVGNAGRIFVVRNASTGTITIACNGAQTINGVTTKTLSVQYTGFQLMSDGANFTIIASF